MQFDGDGRFAFGAFLRRILDHQKDSLGEGDEKAAGGGFEAVEGVAVVGVRHLETEAGARLKIVVEDAIEAEGLGDFFEQRFGVAVQVEILASGLGLEFDGGEEFAGFLAVVGGGVGEGRRGRCVGVVAGSSRAETDGRHFGFERGAGADGQAALPVGLVLRGHGGGLGIEEVGFGHVAGALRPAAPEVQVVGGGALSSQDGCQDEPERWLHVSAHTVDAAPRLLRASDLLCESVAMRSGFAEFRQVIMKDPDGSDRAVRDLRRHVPGVLGGAAPGAARLEGMDGAHGQPCRLGALRSAPRAHADLGADSGRPPGIPGVGPAGEVHASGFERAAGAVDRVAHPDVHAGGGQSGAVLRSQIAGRACR